MPQQIFTYEHTIWAEGNMVSSSVESVREYIYANI